MSRFAVMTFALLLGAAVCAADAPASLDTYKANLQRWSERVSAIDSPAAAQKLRAELPKVFVVVSNNGHRLEADMQWLNVALGEYVTQEKKRDSILRNIQAHLQAMQDEADAYQVSFDSSASRRHLEEILARREFRSVEGPTAWELLQARINQWFWRLMSRVFSKLPTDTQAGQILVWLAIAAGTATAAIWLKRRAQTTAADIATREPILFAPSARNWRRWVADARDAAARGEWRDAVHLAYWAGISRLEEGGAWVPDRARTPREYLRLLPASSDKHPALNALTRQFEVVWYGGRGAGAEEFSTALAQLELLGCC